MNKKIRSILLIPKDKDCLEFDNNMFLPPQAYDAGYGKWVVYSPYERPPYGSLHTFALILYWEGHPIMAGLDFFARGLKNNRGQGWEWSQYQELNDKTPQAIIAKVKSWGMFENSYGELVVVYED